MLITDRFVMLNFPKTGSSFARSVLKELHEPKGVRQFLGRFMPLRNGLREELVVPHRFQPARHAYPSQHGVYVQVPVPDRDKTIMSIMRDPLDRLISGYEFKHWTRYQDEQLEMLRERFPSFPDLSFEEFLSYSYEINLPTTLPPGMRTDVGPLTVQFIRFFARDPLRTMLSLHDGLDLAAVKEEHFVPVRLLHMEHLREELTTFLVEMGYARERLAFIAEKPRVNTTTRSRPEYLTPAIVDRVLHAERFVYQLLPEYLPRHNRPAPWNVTAPYSTS